MKDLSPPPMSLDWIERMVHVGATSERARGDLHNIDAAYREDTRRLIANRFPIAGCIFLGLMAIAYAIEWTYYPERFWSLLLCYGAFVAVLVASVLALRWQPRHALAIV